MGKDSRKRFNLFVGKKMKIILLKLLNAAKSRIIEKGVNKSLES